MTEKEIKCPYCGHNKYKLIKDEICFDEITYSKECENCGRKYD